MATNNRIFYAIQALGFAGHNVLDGNGDPSGFLTASGVQSVGLNTTFNLSQVFELGQLELYENIEGIPDIELTVQKVLDGAPLLYHLATSGATAASLVGRSNERSFVALNIYPDTNDNASGAALQTVGMSGMFVSALTYTLNVDGNSTEDVTLVGNDKEWFAAGLFAGGASFTPIGFDGTSSAPSGVQQREDVVMGIGGGGQVSLWPTEIQGIGSSGNNVAVSGSFSAHIQTVTISTDLGREELFELGRRGPYHRFVTFPVEVTCAIETTTAEGDLIDAKAEQTNLTDQVIDILMLDTTRLILGANNKLASITYGGGDAGGGNAAVTYNYSNFNSLTVNHSKDPAGL